MTSVSPVIVDLLLQLLGSALGPDEGRLGRVMLAVLVVLALIAVVVAATLIA